MTNKELEKKNSELSKRIGSLADRLYVLEKEISNFKNLVSADIKNVIELIKQKPR